MVNIQRIRRYEENVVIYQIHPVSCLVNLIILQNYDKDPHTRYRYDNQYMSKYFWELWELPENSNSTLIIEYNYDQKKYRSYQLLETFQEIMNYRLPEDFIQNQPFPISGLNEYYLLKEIL